jgi:hypothetical protein
VRPLRMGSHECGIVRDSTVGLSHIVSVVMSQHEVAPTGWKTATEATKLLWNNTLYSIASIVAVSTIAAVCGVQCELFSR